MKVAILIVALACVTSVWGAGAPGLSQPTCPTSPAYASCTVSGDPHWTTFDGPGHDFQGAGLYQQVIGDFISVQTIHEACNAPHKVTCIRRAYVQITDPDDTNNWVKYTWGTWPGVAMENVTVIQPGKADIAMLPNKLPSSGLVIMNGALKMTWASNRVNIAWARTTGTKIGPKIAIGEYYLVVSLPKDFHPTGVYQTCGNPWFGTYGLCGYFNNLAGDDFSAQNGTVYVAGAVSGTRYNSPAKAVNQWGSTYAVDGVRHQRIFQGQPGFHMLDTTENVIPTDAESAEAQKTTFADLATLQAADAACKAVSPDTQTYENCMYDAALSPNFDLALSNGAAAAAAAEVTSADDSSSGLSTEAQVGIAVGVAGGVALIAIAVAILYYKKYNVSEYERSKLALVVYDSQHPNNQKAGAAGESSVMDQL